MNRYLFPLFLLIGCHESVSSDPVVVSPSEGAMSGYYDLRIETDADVTEVVVGAHRGFDLVHEPGAVTVTIHGHPQPGPVDIVLTTPQGSERHTDAFTFLPTTPGFETVVAIGASLAQGVQGGVPTQHGQRHSPSFFVARQAGAYHPIPLLVPGLFPDITGADIGPAPECESPDVVEYITSAAVDVIIKLNDEEEDRIGFYLGLVDADVKPYNLAIGGTGVTTLLDGPDPSAFEQGFLARFVFDPYSDITDPLEGSEVSLAEALHPTVILCADTYGNDLLSWRPLEDVRPDMARLVDRLAATDAQVFLSNIPRLTLMPGSGANEERDLLADSYRVALTEEVDRYPNVHIVDLYAAIERDVETGVQVGDRLLSMDAYDGMISSDGLHLSDVGYAYQANLFIETINDKMGTQIEPVDLAEVYPTDNHNPDALVLQGIDPACVK